MNVYELMAHLAELVHDGHGQEDVYLQARGHATTVDQVIKVESHFGKWVLVTGQPTLLPEVTWVAVK